MREKRVIFNLFNYIPFFVITNSEVLVTNPSGIALLLIGYD
jgi:hypothetical protein